jgi:hypothetical protein
MQRITLLTIDAIINLLLGLLLIAFSDGWVRIAGCAAGHPWVLREHSRWGSVRCRHRSRDRKSQQIGNGVGLGLGGAIAINLCGGLVLFGWLVFGDLSLPLRGLIFLWLSGCAAAWHKQRRNRCGISGIPA